MTDDQKQKFKVIGGGLIIACAFAIMMPGFISYLFGLWRIIVLIVTIIIVTVVLVYSYHRFIKKPAVSNKESETPIENPEDDHET